MQEGLGARVFGGVPEQVHDAQTQLFTPSGQFLRINRQYHREVFDATPAQAVQMGLDATPGTVLAAPVTDANGAVLLPAGTVPGRVASRGWS